MIVPPLSIRDVIDKTAAFVVKSGPEIEVRMLREANSAERFAFLFVGHPYRPYYERKMKEIQEGRDESIQTQVPKAVADMWKKDEEKQQRQLMLKGNDKDDYDDDDDDMVEKNGINNAEDELLPIHNFVLKHPYIAPIDR